MRGPEDHHIAGCNRVFPIAFAAVLAVAPHPEDQSLLGPDTVVVQSGVLTLRGLAWRPHGKGPFPAVLFSHGSAPDSANSANGRRDTRTRERGAALLGPIFARHGYVFLYLFRRGAGLSAGQGSYSGDLRAAELAANGPEAHDRLQVRLLEGDELSDAFAGLRYLRSLREVDARRVAVVGHSFGGSLTLLIAEHDSTLRAAIAFASAAGSWRSAPLRERLRTAVSRTTVPIFFIHASNDYSIEPGKSLAADMRRLGKPHRLRIYPAFGRTPEEGHSIVYLSTPTWQTDVFAFLDAVMRP
jgi:dienelactone hydrolase